MNWENGDCWGCISRKPGAAHRGFHLLILKTLPFVRYFISVWISNIGSSVWVSGVVGGTGDVFISVDGLKRLLVLGGLTLNCCDSQVVWSRLSRDRLFVGLQYSLWPAMSNGVGSGWRFGTWTVSPPSNIPDAIRLPSSPAALSDTISEPIAIEPKYTKKSVRLPQKMKKCMTSETHCGLQMYSGHLGAYLVMDFLVLSHSW